MNFWLLIITAYLCSGVVALKSPKAAYFITAATALAAITCIIGGRAGTDEINGYFIFLASIIWFFISIYSLGYDKRDRVLASSFSFTTAMMLVILVSRDALTFLAGWEGMTIASFLSLYSRKNSRHASYTFLAFGELSTAMLLSGFAYAFSITHSIIFSSWHGIAEWSGIFMVLALGFVIKMAAVPFHIWLPEAHSRAPANMSAQLSAVMTLMGVYGLIRFLDVSVPAIWVGEILLAMGAITAVIGAFYAAVCDHVKKLPAYSTVENDGVIIALAGAFILMANEGYPVIGGFVLVSLLFFAFAHSISKSLLFAISGKLEQSGGEYLGGNFHLSKIAIMGGYAAAISLSGIPPLPGYIGEWSALESLFQSFYLSSLQLKLLTVIIGALIALTAGISTVAMSKFIVHGVQRSKTRKYDISDAGIAVGTGVLILCGLFPQLIFHTFSPIVESIAGFGSEKFIGGLLGIPDGTLIISGNGFGVLSPTSLFALITGTFLVLYALIRAKFLKKARIVPVWTGGLKNPEYPARAHSVILLFTQKWLFKTDEDLNYKDSVYNFFVFLGKKARGFGKTFQKALMPGNDRRYVLYMLVSLFVLLILAVIPI